MTHICNKLITSGIFPEHMKYAIVNPLFKKGEKTELTNYRPISILSSFSKIIEKVIYKQLLNHLNKHNILVQEQFGFRSGTAMDKTIYKLINEILNALNNKLMVSGIFSTLKKPLTA